MSREFTLSEHGFMEHALNQAKLAMTNLEVPVGCVFVEDGKIIASGSNRTNETRNATRHAEMEAVDFLLEQWQKDGLSKIDIAERFSRCALYVTCEPCIMCAAALSILGIREVVYGCANDKFGGCGSILSLHESSSEHLSSFSPGKGFTCCGGLMASEAIDLFRCFYEQGNPNARIFCYARLLGALFSDTIRVRIYERRRPRPMKEPKRCVDNINGSGHLLELQLEKS